MFPPITHANPAKFLAAAGAPNVQRRGSKRGIFFLTTPPQQVKGGSGQEKNEKWKLVRKKKKFGRKEKGLVGWLEEGKEEEEEAVVGASGLLIGEAEKLGRRGKGCGSEMTRKRVRYGKGAV